MGIFLMERSRGAAPASDYLTSEHEVTLLDHATPHSVRIIAHHLRGTLESH
jgi:hypothetical protein